MKINHTLMTFAITIAVIFGGTPALSLAESDPGPYIVMIGTPAAGKSVNSELISKTHGIPWVNIRKELLEEVKKESNKGGNSASMNRKRGAASTKRLQNMKAAVAKLEAGELVSDDSLNAFIASEILNDRARNGFILDGYPMTVAQAEFLDSLLELRGMSPLTVIYLNIPDDVALQRMKDRGRADDHSSIGKERLRVFRSMIGPLVDYYGKEAVSEIDATQSEMEIASAIADVFSG